MCGLGSYLQVQRRREVLPTAISACRIKRDNL
jgi:hypothetical protein